MSDNKEYRKNHLQELGGSDFEIVDGQPNIKGWDVKDASGQYLGEVDELLFDPQSRKVRYIVLDLEGNVFDLDAREVLVPIGIAALHENDDDVILTGVTADQLRSLPDYDKDALNSETENTIRTAFTGPNTHTAVVASASANDIDFYDHDHFNESNLYKNRDRRTRNSGMDAGAPENASYGDKDFRDADKTGTLIRMRDADRMNALSDEGLNAERMPNDRALNDELNEDAVSMHARKNISENSDADQEDFASDDKEDKRDI